MDRDDIREILDRVASGESGVQDALDRLRDLPFTQVGDISWDTHRMLRRGVAESIYGAGKTPRQVADALSAAAASGTNCVVTRITPEDAAAVMEMFKAAGSADMLSHHPVPRMLSLRVSKPRFRGRGTVVVVTAGTSDIPVAEEAAVTLEVSGDEVLRVRDVGVAGIHRLAPHLAALRDASAVIVAAGMEGALPGVIAGLTGAPVIGVPTSVGYGTAFGGLTALLAMLNSCAGGLTVVNIDNGYGAAVAAHLINAERPGMA